MVSRHGLFKAAKSTTASFSHPRISVGRHFLHETKKESVARALQAQWISTVVASILYTFMAPLIFNPGRQP